MALNIVYLLGANYSSTEYLAGDTGNLTEVSWWFTRGNEESNGFRLFFGDGGCYFLVSPGISV